ncbi:metal-dependent hydrolase [Microbulbifer rhizosphaerae]|uniref:Inner membrane protein n=1 Tax=Microbulbifer rhizosphaerae TaxID=1562603 RepID=A0A7W4Z8S7_9GAMM|nr:metal-dependent hydrolase [Microbulbifer rhizosphaerae]MBB3060866.1 inner membrane protein [Microbulbifer rhizosphaerae]
MASAFSHVVIPAVIYAAFKSGSINIRLLVVAAALSVLPDLDVVAFKFGIPYESQWGHRGFTHSLVFSAAISLLVVFFHRKIRSKPLTVFAVCFAASVSHAILDAMTNGGLGVALYWPFSSERIFLPYRPIQVSPIGVGAFFTEKGLRVISSELFWVLIPGLVVGTLGALTRRYRAKNK